MRKTVIKTCSCFLEKTVWYINSPTSYPHWLFDAGRYDNLKTFILKKRNSFHIVSGTCIIRETVVSFRMDCFKFQVDLLFDSIFSGLNSLNYRFVSNDNTCFDDGFDNEIFVGNGQFVIERRFLGRRQLEIKLIFAIVRYIDRALQVWIKFFINIFVQIVENFIMKCLKKICIFFLELTMSDFYKIKRKKLFVVGFKPF